MIVPVRRSAAAARVLERANVAVNMRGAPTAAEIDQRYREQILEAAIASAPPEESRRRLRGGASGAVSPAQLAAGYLRQQLGARPAPEDISFTAVPARGASSARTAGDAAPRARAERPDMTGSAWFTLSRGRKHHAEPRWILPLICKAGNITRDDVGAIKVFDEETRFQISAAKAAEYAETVARNGSGRERRHHRPVRHQAAGGAL